MYLGNNVGVDTQFPTWGCTLIFKAGSSRMSKTFFSCEYVCLYELIDRVDIQYSNIEIAYMRVHVWITYVLYIYLRKLIMSVMFFGSLFRSS